MVIVLSNYYKLVGKSRTSLCLCEVKPSVRAGNRKHSKGVYNDPDCLCEVSRHLLPNASARLKECEPIKPWLGDPQVDLGLHPNLLTKFYVKLNKRQNE